MKRLIACGLFAALVCGVASAALSPGQKMAAEALVKRFSAPEFEARQKAVDDLVALGVDVAPVVKEALASTKDNEVKLRCEMVLKSLREKFGAAAVDGTGAAGPAAAKGTQPEFDASKVTLDLKDATLGEALDALSKQSGNAPVDAKNFKDRAVTVSVKDVPYWEAFDAVMDAAGVVYSPPWFRGAPPTVLASKGKEPTLAAYAGPAVVWIDRVVRQANSQKWLRFHTDAWGVNAPETQRTVMVAARAFVEDRVKASGVGVGWTKAVAADGKDVLPKFAGNPMAGPSQGLSIPDTEEGIKGPLALEGFVRLTFYVGAIERKADDVFAAKQTVGDDELGLKDIFAIRLNKSVQVSLTATGTDARLKLISYDTPAGFGFALVDPEGKRYKQSSWSQTQHDIVLGFPDVADIAGKWSLVLTLPDRVETKEFPFAFKAVPLP